MAKVTLDEKTVAVIDQIRTNLHEAVRLLGTYTAGRFDIWMLAGNAKRTCRQHVMTVLINGKDGKKIPQKDCGVTMIRTKFYDLVQPQGDCLAARETYFIQWCRSVGSGLTDEMYLDYVNNFVTVDRFAEHYGLDEDKARMMIDNYRPIRDNVMGITPKG